MAALDLTTFDYALKELYPVSTVANLTYKDRPLLAALSKSTDFYGDNLVVPVEYANPQGRSATFSTAVTNKRPTLGVKFNVTRARDYVLADIDNETILASANDKGALARAIKTENDNAIRAISNQLAADLYGTGSGSLGQVGNASPTTTITLSNIEDVVKFDVGMELKFSTADGTGSEKAGNTDITDINRDTGVLTVADDLSASPFTSAVAQNDYIFVQGDHAAKIKGLSAWVPSTAPTATTFFGVDRTSDTVRLGGMRYDGSADPIEETLVKAAIRLTRHGGSPDYVYMNPTNFGDLINALGSKKQYTDVEMEAGIGFRALTLQAGHGEMKVMSDRFCPVNRAFMLQMDTWKLHSLGPCPQTLDTDGLSSLRNATADSVEVRHGYYAQLYCKAPGYNANIQLA
jgi:hypothetical protein